MEEMVKFTTTENLKTNKIYLDNWRPDSKNSNWSKSVEFIELQPKCSLETFFNANFENPMGTWRGGYEKKGVHQARIAKKWTVYFSARFWFGSDPVTALLTVQGSGSDWKKF